MYLRLLKRKSTGCYVDKEESWYIPLQEKSIDFSPSWPFRSIFPRKPLGLFSQYPALWHRWQMVYFSWLFKTSTPLGEEYSLHSPQFITSLPGTCSLFSHLVFSYPSASPWGNCDFWLVKIVRRWWLKNDSLANE